MSKNKLISLSEDELVYNAGTLRGSDGPEAAHAELMRRLIIALRESKESADVSGDRMLYLTGILLVIALLQLLVVILPMPDNPFIRFGIFLLMIVCVLVSAWWLIKEVKRKQD